MERDNNTNTRKWGVALIAVGLLMLLLFAIVSPKALVVGSASAVPLFVFGGLMLSGRWPSPRR